MLEKKIRKSYFWKCTHFEPPWLWLSSWEGFKNTLTVRVKDRWWTSQHGQGHTPLSRGLLETSSVRRRNIIPKTAHDPNQVAPYPTYLKTSLPFLLKIWVIPGIWRRFYFMNNIWWELSKTYRHLPVEILALYRIGTSIPSRSATNCFVLIFFIQ